MEVDIGAGKGRSSWSTGVALLGDAVSRVAGVGEAMQQLCVTTRNGRTFMKYMMRLFVNCPESER